MLSLAPIAPHRLDPGPAARQGQPGPAPPTDQADRSPEGQPAGPGGPTDLISLSPRAQDRLSAERSSDTRAGGSDDPFTLSEGEEQVVEQLRARDQEVRNHEEAHARVGGPYAGSPSYEYTVGPDNKRYAVSGSVPIDTSPVPDDPEATIQKMEVVKAAALAPAQPSGQDIKVAGIAEQRKQEASAELRALRQAEARGAVDPTTGEPALGTAAGAYAAAAGLGGAGTVATGPTGTGGDVTGLIGLVA